MSLIEILQAKKINLVLIGFDLTPDDEATANKFIQELKKESQSSNPLEIACDAHLLLDPSTGQVDQLFCSLANF